MNENSTDRKRDRLMAALSSLEYLLANCPVLPLGFTLDRPFSDDGMFDLDLRFYRSPEDVATFAASLDLPVTYRPDHASNGKPYVEARGTAHGLAIRAWALGQADEQERYAACVPVSEESAPGVAGMPGAWVAAGAA